MQIFVFTLLKEGTCSIFKFEIFHLNPVIGSTFGEDYLVIVRIYNLSLFISRNGGVILLHCALSVVVCDEPKIEIK